MGSILAINMDILTSQLLYLINDGGRNININIWISFFDVVMIALILIGAYRGFSQGVIPQCITSFAIVLGLTLCVNLAKSYNTFVNNKVEYGLLSVSAIFLLLLLFIGVIYGTIKLSNIINDHIASLEKGFTNRVLGAIFGAIKYYFITSILLISLIKIDNRASFLPDTAKNSKFTKISTSIIKMMYPCLKSIEEVRAEREEMEKNQRNQNGDFDLYDYPKNN